MSLGRKNKSLLAASFLLILSIMVVQYFLAIADPTAKNLLSQSKDITIKQGFWVDSSASHSLSDVLNQGDIWQERDLSQVPWRFSQQGYWLRLELINTSAIDENIVFHFVNPMVEQLTVYHIQSLDSIDVKRLGWQATHLSRQQRAMPSFSLDIKAFESEQVFVHIHTKGIAKTPIHIYYHEDFASLQKLSLLIWGSFVGILIVIALYNLVLYSGLKETVYLAYIAYVLSVLAMLGVVMGFGHYIWPPSWMPWMRTSIVALNTAVIICTLAFALLIFKSLKRASKIERISWRYLHVLCVFACISLFIPEYIAAPVFFVAMAGVYSLLVCFFYKQYHTLHPWARYYMASWLPIIVAGALQPMTLTGVIGSSFLLYHALMVGVLIEIVLMAMALVSRMQHKKMVALYNAEHDYGTGLPNLSYLEGCITRLEKQDKPFALCLIEIEEFEALQPYLTRAEADELMLLVSKIINTHMMDFQYALLLETKNDTSLKVARIRDGMFGFILINESKSQLKESIKKIQAQLSTGVNVGELELDLMLCSGISLFQAHSARDDNYVLKQAQQALAMASHSDHRIAYFQADFAIQSEKKLLLAARLQSALRQNKLALYHQPQIDLHTLQVHGSEVLLRWTDEQFGFIAPDEFIPLAEDTGIINELTLWVVEQACKDLQHLAEQGFSQHGVSINISGKDIAEASFLDKVKPILLRYQAPLNNLTFELTETVMVRDFHLLKKTMIELRSMGVNIAIDDYGTGYSSLFYLSQLPFSELKIDKSFVIDLDTSNRHQTIVSTTLEMAKSLGLRVVAEGVETSSIADILCEQGCHLAQGYYYQRPLPLEQYCDWLAQRPSADSV